MTLASTILSILTLPLIASAMPPIGRTYDNDMTVGRGLRVPFQLSLNLAPDHIEASNDNTPLSVVVIRMDHGLQTAITGLTFEAKSSLMRTYARTNLRGLTQFAQCANPNDMVTLTAPLQDDRMQVTSNGRSVYQIVAQVPCHGVVKLEFDTASNGGQALGIWQIASKAKAKLQTEMGLDFWTRHLAFKWPADGDYYDGVVNITRGDQWDVVGHEMGHAIYDMGDLGVFGGGEHKIDQCYSAAMALSEGWASYFSAWVSLDLRDPDAKFEFMVPRRAPIRFENIPADVCRGPNNEWRVTGFFWDLVDQHDDGEISQVSFKSVWQVLLHQKVQDMNQVRALLLKAGFDPNVLTSVWNLNF